MSIIGIDPGVTGAIAILRGAETEIHDMPVLDVKGGHDFNRLEIVHLLSGAGAEHVYIERVQPMGGPKFKGRNGAKQTFQLGCALETLRTACAALRLPYTLVSPQVWKRKFGLLQQTKDASRAAALRLFPEQAERLNRKKDHNRAEALLIAAYGREMQAASEGKAGATKL